MEDKRAYSVDDELIHYGVPGMKWKNHKYRTNINGQYVYEGITNAARRGINTVNSYQQRAGQATNKFLNSTNAKKHEQEEARAKAEKARQERIQSALTEATKNAEARKKAKTEAQKERVNSVMEPFRKVEETRKAAVKEIDRQKKVNAKLKQERQEKLAKTKENIKNLPKKELDWWKSPTRQKGQQAIQKVSAKDFIAENEKRARAAAAKKNNASQRDAAVKEKSASAHSRSTSNRRTKKRSAAKNKQRIANAKASRAR